MSTRRSHSTRDVESQMPSGTPFDVDDNDEEEDDDDGRTGAAVENTVERQTAQNAPTLPGRQPPAHSKAAANSSNRPVSDETVRDLLGSLIGAIQADASSDDAILQSCESERRYYPTCHTESEKTSTATSIQSHVVGKIGKWQNRRMTPPIYRDHVKVHDRDQATEPPTGPGEDFSCGGGDGGERRSNGGGKAGGRGGNDLFKILATECMEQLYDDNIDASFGSVEVLAFGRLHHMNLHYFEAELAAELADVVSTKTTDRKQLLRIRRGLRGYSDAINDYNIVLNHWKQPRAGQLTAFQRVVLPQRFREHISPPHDAAECSAHTKRECQHASWDNGCITLSSGNPWGVALSSRIAAALLGSLAFIVPLLIMGVNHAPKRNLITTSVFVVVAAMLLACTSLGTWKDVLGITAAYAAVLIVFVGTSAAEVSG